MNTGFYSDLNENFEQAYTMCQKDYTHSELIEMLKNGNIPQKQIAALRFDYVETEEDALALLSNLTGCDGKIREAVALKINKLLSENTDLRLIFAKLSYYKLADATIDINANICRLAVDSAVLLKSFNEFSKYYTDRILEFTMSALDELDKFIFRDKKYVINKQLFKLYWCLEALNYFYDEVEENVLKVIITKSSNQKEYTIREKVAQILCTSKLFPEIRKQLEYDENYYVRQIFLNH